MKKTVYKINYGGLTVGNPNGYNTFEKAHQEASDMFGVEIGGLLGFFHWNGHNLSIIKEEFDIPEPFKQVIEDVVYFDSEDGGRALIAHLDNTTANNKGMFVRLHSWDGYKNHTEMKALQGKKVRVTIEEIS